jgi:hypothetical protein
MMSRALRRLIAKFGRSRVTRDSSTKSATQPLPTHSDTLDPFDIPSSDSSRSERDKASHDGCDRLQSLPPEVRRHLLSLLDLSRLKALVHASPIFHQQYLYDRSYLLSSSLEHTLRGAAVDAFAVTILSKSSSSTVDTLMSLKELYPGIPQLVGKLTEIEAVNMAMFYWSAKSISDYFGRWALVDLVRLTGGHHDTGFSNMENLRLMRATYRFQIVCQLVDPVDRSRRTAAKEEAVLPFLSLLEPWEIEEMFSFYQFAQSIYSKVFDDIRLDVHPENPRFDDQGRPPTPEGAFEMENYGKRYFTLLPARKHYSSPI